MERYRIIKNVSYCDSENGVGKPENSGFIGFWGVMDGVVRWFPKWFKGGKSGRKLV